MFQPRFELCVSRTQIRIVTACVSLLFNCKCFGRSMYRTYGHTQDCANSYRLQATSYRLHATGYCLAPFLYGMQYNLQIPVLSNHSFRVTLCNLCSWRLVVKRARTNPVNVMTEGVSIRHYGMTPYHSRKLHDRSHLLCSVHSAEFSFCGFKFHMDLFCFWFGLEDMRMLVACVCDIWWQACKAGHLAYSAC
jgi:hypothetical protein